MKRSTFCALAAMLALAGCGSGGYDSRNDGGGGTGMQPPPPPVGAAFTPFVRAQFAATSNEAEAAAINDQEFTFDEDEAAYADLL
jgi:hypothetical protein